MVNAAARIDEQERHRPQTADHGVLGTTKLNPFGDLHTMQHLSARLARSLRGLFESLLREELRCWAEPLVVQRFADYRAERGDGLSAGHRLDSAGGDLGGDLPRGGLVEALTGEGGVERSHRGGGHGSHLLRFWIKGGSG